MSKRDNEGKDEGRRKEFLAMMEEESRNAVISNLVEAASVSPDNRVQLILSKIFSEEDLHACKTGSNQVIQGREDPVADDHETEVIISQE